MQQQTSAQIKIGLLSDTHGVFDPAAAKALVGTQLLLHAGDVGNHGGHEEVLRHFTDATGTPLLAVAGNVDDQLDAAGSVMLPGHRLVTAGGWQILLTHVVAPGPAAKVDAAAALLIQKYKPDIVVFGHSHKAASWCTDGVVYINPGSAGPARFKLPRSVATLTLPCRLQSAGAGSETTAGPNCPELWRQDPCRPATSGPDFNGALAALGGCDDPKVPTATSPSAGCRQPVGACPCNASARLPNSGLTACNCKRCNKGQGNRESTKPGCIASSADSSTPLQSTNLQRSLPMASNSTSCNNHEQPQLQFHSLPKRAPRRWEIK